MTAEAERPARAEPGRNLPLAAPEAERERFAFLADHERMRALLQRVLPPLARGPLRVTRCKAKVQRSRAALREGRIRIIYRLGIAAGDGPERELVVLGTAPEDAAFLESAAVRAVGGHPSLAPFAAPGLHVPELDLALRIYPLDPHLPALAELEGPGGPALLAPYLGLDGAAAPRVERELCHYKPFKRAVLRLRMSAAGSPPRTLYAKLFADERGARFHREQRTLWEATRGARALRMPEPLGWDAGRRMLVMAEAPGGSELIDWIKALENRRALTPGVEPARVRRCLERAAEALAELQASGIEPELALGYRGQLARLAKDRQLLEGELSRRLPELTRRARALLARLERHVPAREQLVPAHGGFRHKQTVGDESTLAIIDWDGLCRADPALDAATFLLRLRQEPLCDPGGAPEMEALAAHFRRAFLARVPRVAPAHLARYEGLTLTIGLLRSFRRALKDEGLIAGLSNQATAAAEALALAEGAGA